MASTKVGPGTDDTSSEMGQVLERKKHPLLTDVILKILFEFMGGKDLKTCRLVCKKWCELTVPSSRSKFTIKLNGSGVLMTRRLRDFVGVFRENKLGIPFDKYYFDPFCATKGAGQEFLQICGSTAKTLSLTQDECNMRTAEVEDISEILKAMPNIESFGISHHILSRSRNVVKLFPDGDDSSTKPKFPFLKTLTVYDDADKTNECCPTFVEEIISVAPNISAFRIKDSRHAPERSRIQQVLKAIEKFGRASVVRNLHFVNGSTEHFEYLLRLAENGLKLKHLVFIRTCEENSFKYLPQLATSFKNSIEDLRVDEVCPSFCQLPHMPKLKSLEFDISEEFDSKSVNLNKLLPALNALELFYWEYADGDEYEWDEILPNSEPCPNLTSLSLIQVVLKIQPFDHILNIFPNLNKLQLHVRTDGERILRKIMTQLSQLEELSVSGIIEGIENIDAFLTGIPVQKVHKLEHFLPELKEMSVHLRSEVIQHYRTRYCHSPSITNLTSLKRLRLCTIGRRSEEEDETRMYTGMTDVFVYFGLQFMKHINKLEIEKCEFTKSGCELLTTEMGLKSWTFQDLNDVNIIPEVD